MKARIALLLFAVLASCSPKQSRTNESAAAHAPVVDFAWRAHQGDFPKDKPGYLILTTEDALDYSKILPLFVKQKESMGFHVYVATEKDYGTGKTGNAQAAQVRAWMNAFHKRAGLQYALLIGNSNPNSSDLPSPVIPDGEHGGMEESYADLDGAWVDLYLNTIEKDTHSGWVQMCAMNSKRPATDRRVPWKCSLPAARIRGMWRPGSIRAWRGGAVEGC